MRALLIFILLCLLVLSQQRFYDGETDFRIEADDYTVTAIYLWSIQSWPAIYLGLTCQNGPTFHLLMYQNTSYFIQLEDKGLDTLRLPEHAKNRVIGLEPHHFGVPELNSAIPSYHYKLITGTLAWNNSGYEIFNPWNVTIGYINYTFDTPFLSKPIVFSKSRRFVESLTIAPILRRFRAEDYHPAYFACMLAFYVISLCLCVIFCKIQPLKSRGAVPILACVLQFLLLLPDLLHFIPRPVQNKGVDQNIFYDYTFWIVHNYSRYSVVLVFMVLSITMAMRFIILLNVNARKELFIRKQDKEVVEVKWYWKIIKFSGSPWLTPILMVFWYIVFSSYLSLGWINSDTRSHFWFLAVIPALIVLAFITLIADILTNIRHLRKCEWRWLYRDDIFLFRFELYVLTLFVLFPWCILFYLIISDDNVPTIYYINDTHNGLLYAVNTISFFFFYIIQVGFVLTVTIIRFIRERCTCRKAQGSEEILTAVLNSKESHDIFEAYCKQEFSVENVALYDELQDYKKKKDERSILSMRIWKLYLNGSSSELEVNISGATLAAIGKKVQEISVYDENAWTENLFEAVEQDVISNLTDTWFRFRTTREWLHFVHSKNFMQEVYGAKTPKDKKK